MANNQVTLDFEGLASTAELQDGQFQQGTHLEQVSVVDETNPTAQPRVAKLVPVPGSSDSFYLSYDGEVREGDPVYTLPAKPLRKKMVNVGPVTTTKGLLKPVGTDTKPILMVGEGVKNEVGETLFATSQLEAINTYTDSSLTLGIKAEPAGVIPSLMIGGDTLQGAEADPDEDDGQNEEMEAEEGEVDFFDDPGDELDLIEAEVEEEEANGNLPTNVKDKIDQVVKHSGGYKFSGSWKKPPKEESLVKARMEVLQQILDHYKRTCKVCFEQQHTNTEQDCPLLNPADTIPNNAGCAVRFGMPDEIVFGASRVYEEQDSLFARDEIPEYTQFGPIQGKIATMHDLATMGVVRNEFDVSNLWPFPTGKIVTLHVLASMGVVRNELDVSNLWPFPIEEGKHEFDFQQKCKIVTMHDLASMGVVRNELDVSNLWPFPIEEGQHEFDFQHFLDTQHIAQSNWLKFIKVESPKEEHPPYNIQTVYKGKEIYFVTTKEIEPGGELFLRAIEPPSRVYYNMHRLKQVFYNYCGRAKCKKGQENPLYLHNLVNFVRHQLFIHFPDFGTFSWAAIYNCNLCGEDCFDKVNHKKHLQQRHNESNDRSGNRCRFCNLVLATKSGLYHHTRLNHPDVGSEVVCDECGKRYKNAIYLRQHYNLSHKEDPRSCELCGKKYMNYSRLKVHILKVHKSLDKMKQCEVCGAHFKLAWNLQVHMRRHERDDKARDKMGLLGEVYYNFCSRMKCKPSKEGHLHLPHLLAFVRHQFLVHQPEHSVFSWAAIYNCTVCHQDCFDKESFEGHMKQEHNILNIKKPPNSCRFCGIVLKTKNYMYKHIQIHHGNSDANQVPCPYCGKSFKHSVYLQNHIKGSHTDEPEPCPICNRICKNRSRMRSHLRKVHRTNLSEVEQFKQEIENEKKALEQENLLEPLNEEEGANFNKNL